MSVGDASASSMPLEQDGCGASVPQKTWPCPPLFSRFETVVFSNPVGPVSTNNVLAIFRDLQYACRIMLKNITLKIDHQILLRVGHLAKVENRHV